MMTRSMCGIAMVALSCAGACSGPAPLPVAADTTHAPSSMSSPKIKDPTPVMPLTTPSGVAVSQAPAIVQARMPVANAQTIMAARQMSQGASVDTSRKASRP